METIEIENFKGYHTPAIKIEPAGKNLLLFGENGAGKSSLYEALRHFFFSDKIESVLVPASATPEDREQKLQEYYAGLRFSGESFPSVIQVNGHDVNSFNRQDYRVFLVSPVELETRDEISLVVQMKNWYFDGALTDVLENCYSELQDEVNRVLTNDFREAISIQIDKRLRGSTNEYLVVVNDTRNNRSHISGLSSHFNESRLHLVQLLLMLEIVHLLYEKGKKNILVLDDFVTSLDAANRSFVVRYVLKNFSGFQLLVMTHSAGFYNLFKYEANILNNNKWSYGCLYGVEGACKYYMDKEKEDIKVDVSAVSDANPVSLKEAGNKLRRTFEILVHRLARHLSIGGIEESHKLLENINATSTLYRNGEKGADSILDEINSLALCEHYKDTELGKKISEKLAHYKLNLDYLQDILKQMELFQKVALHPTSHATAGTGVANPVHKKELVESARILEELCNYMKKIEAHEEALF